MITNLWLKSQVLQSLSSTASFPSFFLIPSSHSIFLSHLCLLPLQKKSSFAMLTCVENTFTGRRRNVFWHMAERLKASWKCYSAVFQAICHRILWMKKNKWKPIFAYFSLYFTQSLLRRTGKLSANIFSKANWILMCVFSTFRTNVQIQGKE